MERFLPPYPEEEKNKAFPLVIVGGGLSGSVLAVMAAERGWRTLLIEPFLPAQQVKKAYLVSAAVGRAFGLKEEWQRLACRRGRITGFSTFAVSDGKVSLVEEIDPSWAKEQPERGFVVFPQEELLVPLWKRIVRAGGEIATGAYVTGIDSSSHCSHLALKTSSGQNFLGKFVVDCTGTNLGRHNFAGEWRGKLSTKARIRAVYGFPIEGEFASDRLIFLTGLHRLGFPKGSGVWLMPQGGDQAELILNQTLSLGGAEDWFKQIHQRWLSVAEVFARLPRINFNPQVKGKKPILAGYRTSPASINEIEDWSARGLIPFGEIIGFNWPGIGQMIDLVIKNASFLLDSLSLGSLGGVAKINREFFRKWREQLNYRVLSSLANTRQIWAERTGFSSNLISSALARSAQREALWRVIGGDRGIVSPEVVAALLVSPQCWRFIAEAILEYGRLTAEEVSEKIRM